MFIPGKKNNFSDLPVFLPSEKQAKYHSKKNQLISSLIQSLFRSIQDLRFNDKTALLKNKRSNLFMVADLSIKEDSKEGIHIFYVGGRLDVTSAPLLEKKLQPILETPDAKVVINFSEMTYLSSAGLRVMLYAHKRLKASKGQLVFCCMKPPVMEIIKLAGFETILKIFDKEYEALKALKIKDTQD
jgi:anti-anti-sigma factor